MRNKKSVVSIKFQLDTTLFCSGKLKVFSSLPDQHHLPGQELAESYAAQGFVSIQFANKLGIIRTLPGYAPSIASLIDKFNPFEIVGTLAGDDTILIIPHDNVTEKDVINTLIIIIPELKSKIK